MQVTDFLRTRDRGWWQAYSPLVLFLADYETMEEAWTNLQRADWMLEVLASIEYSNNQKMVEFLDRLIGELPTSTESVVRDSITDERSVKCLEETKAYLSSEAGAHFLNLATARAEAAAHEASEAFEEEECRETTDWEAYNRTLIAEGAAWLTVNLARTANASAQYVVTQAREAFWRLLGVAECFWVSRDNIPAIRECLLNFSGRVLKDVIPQPFTKEV